MGGILGRCRWAETRCYIGEKERERRYPLNKFNEMDVIIRLAPLTAKLVHDLTSKTPGIWGNTRAFSTPRLFRIYMSTLIATATAISRDIVAVEAARALRSALETRLRVFPASEHGPEPESGADGALLGDERLMHLFAIAREVADRAGFGDHTMYAHAPVPDQASGDGHGFSEALFFQDHVQGTLPALCFQRSGFHSPLPRVDVFRGKHAGPVRGEGSISISLTIEGSGADAAAVTLCHERLRDRLLMEDDILSLTVEEIALHKACTYITDLRYHLGLEDREGRERASQQLSASTLSIPTPTARFFCDLVERGEQAAAQ